MIGRGREASGRHVGPPSGGQIRLPVPLPETDSCRGSQAELGVRRGDVGSRCCEEGRKTRFDGEMEVLESLDVKRR